MDAQNPNVSSTDISFNNISSSNNPFIWGHIALLAGVPWLLSLSMAGLAVGDPVFPAWFEIILLGFPAIALVTWVQWQKPLSPFSLWVVAKPTESLSEHDRRILTLIKQYSNGWYVTGWIAIAVAALLSVVFCKIYISAPLAQAIAPFPNWLRFLGILWAEFFFLLSNVLLQAGFSALRVQLTPESELLSLQPFAIAKIKNSFTNIAWRSPQLLKFFEDEQIIIGSKAEIIKPTKELDERSEFVADESLAKDSAFEIVPEISDKKTLEESEEVEVLTLLEEENPEMEAIAEPGILDNISHDFNQELDELIAFNIYIENILQNYLEEPLEEVNEVESITEMIATSELVAEIGEEVLASEETLAESIELQPIFVSELEVVVGANIPINMETIADNLLAIKTEVTEEIPESLSEGEAENERKEPEYKESAYKESAYKEQELLVDEFLARIQSLNVAEKANAEKANKESLNQAKEPVAEVNVCAEVDVFADLEALLDDKPLPENLE